MRLAVFVDRDGTINDSLDFVLCPEEFRLLPGVGEAVRALNQAGWLVIVVSNQSAVGRGMLSTEGLRLIDECMKAELANFGAHVDAILYCIHSPDEACECRKPSPLLIQKAAAQWGIDLARSWVVGDMTRDIETGRRAGCQVALVLSGHGKEEAANIKGSVLLASDLKGVVEHIISMGGGIDEGNSPDIFLD